MTIIQSIKVHPESYTPPPTTYLPPVKNSTYKKPERWTESKATRIKGSNIKPHKTEYQEAVKDWAERCGNIIVGQKLYVKFHPNGPWHERIFTRVLPPDDSYVILPSSMRQKEVQIIEVWNQEHDVFVRVDPLMCSVTKD